MKKRFTLLMTMVIALCTSSAWAQSVVSVGTNLDFSEGTPVDNGICTYGKDMAGNNTTYYGELAVDGWTAQPKGTTDDKGYENSSLAGGLFAYGSGHWLGGAGYNVPATNPEGVAEGNALGIIGVWSGTVQYVQAVTLEPGDYVISALVYNAVGGTTGFVKNLIGFIADNGTEYLASTKTYAVDTWTVENIKFTLTETTAGKLSLGYAAAGTGSGGNQHLFIDKVEVLAVTEADLARIDLNAALVSAQATVDAKVGVGAGVFMYSEEAYNAYAAAVAAAKAVSENAEATKDELVEALAALNAATAAYTVTVPAADAIYAVKFNGSDNYLTIGESTITIDAAVDTLSFEAVGNGKYYVHDNAGKYIYYSGTGNNIWSMSAAADKKDEWTISVNAEGLYAFVGKNGGIGVDGTEAGASCYGDKKGAAMALWTITEIVIEDEPGNEGGDDVVVAEGNLIENPGFEKWEGGNPVNWAGVGHNATIKQSADAKSGSYAVEVAGANANKRLASQAYTLKPGTYKYSVNVKQTGDAAGMYRLGYIKLTDGAIANTSTDYIYITEPASVSAEWSEVSCEFTLEAATEIALVVMNSKNGKGASILVDDVALTTNNGGNEGGDDEGEEEQKPISGTIAEVVAAGVQASASTSGTVVATYARGFLIGDGTGYVLTYLGKDSGLAVGDVVTVAGATSMYGGLLQFGNASTFEKTGTATFTQPDPEVLDGAAMDAYLAAPVIKYVQYTGTLAISGNYYNVTVDGAQKAVGSIQYAPEGLVDAALNGKKIVVTGYSIGVSSSKYVNTMGVSVVAAEEEPAVKTDYTDAIVNADLSTTEAWDASQTKGIKDGMVKVGGNVFDFTQTITLPAGQYKMTAKAAYRYANSTKPEEEYEYNQIQAGVETHLAKLYAETSSYKYEANVMNRWDGASDTDFANGSGSVTVNGKFVPNSSAAVQAWFNAGQYVNELIFNVQEDGAVKIGIAKTENCPDGDYTNIGAWTLTRLGDAEADPKEEEPTPDPEEPEETIDMDLTHLVGTSKEAWNAPGGPVNIDGISMPEKYETTTATLGDVMWQEVTGLENGKYTVELWANARYTSGRGFESAATDGQLECTYLFANNVELSIPVVYNADLNSNTSHVLEGVEVTDGTLKMGMTKKADGSNWHTIQIKSLIYHAPANAALDMAKVDLQAALDAANAVEPKKDDFVAAIAAAQDVYDNSKVVEEIEAATATLKEATKLAILGNASPSNPVLTDFVINGTFDTTTAPWQTTTGAQNKALASNQQGAFTGNFFENWNPSAVTGKIYQVIENVPNGIYDLSICAFVNTFDASVQFVYANADKVALTTGEPTAYVVRTIVENNTIEVGFEQTEAVANWMGIDNVSLTYLGEYSDDAEVNMAKANFTAAYDEFNAALSACQAMMLKVNFYEVADAADQLNAQLESATDIEVLNAMVAQLNEATASLNEINAVYAEYNVYVQKFKAAAEFSEPLTTEAAELLEFNMYGGAGMQAMSIEALKQAIEQIKADYLAYAGNAKLYDGHMFDFTYLIQNPDFEANLDGWTANKANRIGGEGYDGVGGIAEIGEWGASSWDASMSQAITGLPNGKYVVKAAWMSATGIEMTFAANEGATTVTGIGDTGGNIAKDGSVVEMGQGHRGWQYVEVEGLVEDGTLTILVSSSSATQYQWSNADAFELYYAGVPAVVEPEYLPVVGAKVGDVDIVEGAATVESISTIDVTFDRPVALAENAGWATLTDSWGDNSLQAEVLADNNCVVRFALQWEQVFTEAGDFYFYVPEGFVVAADDASVINAAIEAVITIEAAPATPLAVVNVTVGEDVMADLNAIVATTADMIKVNFDGEFYFQGMPTFVDAEGNDASEHFEFVSGLDFDGSNSYILMGKKAGIYTITLPKASFLEMYVYKAPAEDIVLTVQITDEGQGISNITVDADTVIYDLSGRRVTEMTKGIYIVNGKKVIKK